MHTRHHQTPAKRVFLAILWAFLISSTGCGKPKYTSEPLSETAPILSVANSLDFETVLLETTKHLEIKIQNTGNSPLIIRSIYTLNEQRFTLSGITTVQIEPSDEAVATIGFAPSQVGLVTSELIIESNDTNSPTTSVLLRGIGAVPGDDEPISDETCIDVDEDGFGLNCNEGPDCDDEDPTVQAPSPWYADADHDTYGSPLRVEFGCHPPAGYVADDSDCDDTNPDVNIDRPEVGDVLCTDGLDNDCDGEPDSFDTDCTFEDCGEPAYVHTTDVCDPEYPSMGPSICEEYPNSIMPEGYREQCMQICRNRRDCPDGFACYPSRRSLNLHFCAPALGVNLQPDGASCVGDSGCQSAVCHDGSCRGVCTRDADCTGQNEVCYAVVRTHSYIGSEIATGLCVPKPANRLPYGEICTSAIQCESGVCSAAYIDQPARCSKPCGTMSDCPWGDRCAPAIYDNNPNVGYGFRSCGPAPESSYASIGESCYTFGATECRSFFCDSTHPSLLEPYCTGHCDADTDCPMLYPGAHNLKMKCTMGSSMEIAPLIGGYCTPKWCNADADCNGTSCFIFNDAGADGMPKGICQAY